MRTLPLSDFFPKEIPCYNRKEWNSKSHALCDENAHDGPSVSRELGRVKHDAVDNDDIKYGYRSEAIDT